MSNVEAPNINSGDTNNPDLLAEQSGTPNMSSSKTFTVDTNMQVNGDLTVISDGAFVRMFTAAGTGGDSDAPSNPRLLSIGGSSLWDTEIEVLNDFKIHTGDDIDLIAEDDVEISAEENVNINSVDSMSLESEDNIYLTAEGKIDLESEEYIELNSEVRMVGDVVMIENLPSTDPVNAGQLWNDNGTLKVSAG